MQQRRFRLLLAYATLLLPVVVFYAAQALRSEVNSPLEWAPSTDSARTRYDDFAERFGSGDVVIASWSTCDVSDPTLDKLTASLRSDIQFFDGSEWLFDSVICGREFVSALTNCGVSLNDAISRVQGSLIGSDRRTTCIVVGFTRLGVSRRAELVPLIQQAIEHTCGVSPRDQHLAGPIIDGLSVDSASAATLRQLAPLSSVIVLLAALWCLQSWREAAIVFVVSLYCQGVTLALIAVAGDSVTALLVVLPPLIQVLAIAAGLHLVNYYREGLREGSPSLAAQRCVTVGWLPCLLSAGTTAIGMASLMVSRLTPIRSFGAYASAGILITAAVVSCCDPGIPRAVEACAIIIASVPNCRNNASGSC